METTLWNPSKLSIGATIATESPIIGIDFHEKGHFMVMATKDSALYLIDCLLGMEKKKIFMKSHGIGIVKFTHHESCVIVSSEKKNHDIRYVSITDNKYLRYFKGHTAKVVSMSMSPINDTFLSASVDGIVYLWDLSSPKQLGRLQLDDDCANIRVTFDPSSGTVFAVMARDIKNNKQMVKLYATDDLQRGPFLDIAPSSDLIYTALSKVHPPLSDVQKDRYLSAIWTDLEFAPDGKTVLVNTNTDLILVLDAYDVEKEPMVVTSRKNESGLMNLGFCFSSDGKYIISANEDKEIIVLNAQYGNTTSILLGHVSTVTNIRCNPKYDVMASTCASLALWITPNNILS